MNRINTIIFDLGGVLIDWNPRYLYRKIFKTENEITWFLENICTSEWNDKQDGGRSFEEATAELVGKHPEWKEAIEAWYGRWEETINGEIAETVELLRYFHKRKAYRLYALTNWSAESFPVAQLKFDFLKLFDGIVVSGIEKKRKPFPEFYQILFDRYSVTPRQALFIDDNIKNVQAGKALGMATIHFASPQQLKEELKILNIL